MSIFKKAFNWFIAIFHTAIKELEEVILPATVHFLNAVETVVQNPLTEEIVNFFHNDITTDVFESIKKALPGILAKWDLVIDGIENLDTVEKLNAALQKLLKGVTFNDLNDKGEFLTTMGAKIIQEVTDHKMSFATAVMQLEYYFQRYHKDQAQPDLIGAVQG